MSPENQNLVNEKNLQDFEIKCMFVFNQQITKLKTALTDKICKLKYVETIQDSGFHLIKRETQTGFFSYKTINLYWQKNLNPSLRNCLHSFIKMISIIPS